MSSNQPADFQQNPIFYEMPSTIQLFADEGYQKNEIIPSSSNCSFTDPRIIHKCNVCHKIFKAFKGLKQHAIVHTADRPFKCTICSKHFRFKSNLFEHQSVHSAVAPYSCSYCGKACRLKGNLKKHLRVHVTSKEELEAAFKPFSAKKSTKKYKAEQSRYWEEDCPTIFDENQQNDQQFTDFTELNRELEKSIERVATPENSAPPSQKSIEMEKNYIERSIIHNSAVRTWSDLMEIAKLIFFEDYNCPVCHTRLMSRAICFDHFNLDQQCSADPFHLFCTKCFRRFDDEKSYKKHLDYHDYVLDFIRSTG